MYVDTGLYKPPFRPQIYYLYKPVCAYYRNKLDFISCIHCPSDYYPPFTKSCLSSCRAFKCWGGGVSPPPEKRKSVCVVWGEGFCPFALCHCATQLHVHVCYVICWVSMVLHYCHVICKDVPCTCMQDL